VDYGDGPQTATSRPRIHDEGEKLQVDSRIPEDVRGALAAMGHEIEVKVEDVLATNFARPGAIQIDSAELRGGGAGTNIGSHAGEHRTSCKRRDDGFSHVHFVSPFFCPVDRAHLTVSHRPRVRMRWN